MNDKKLVPDKDRIFTTTEIKNALGCNKTLVLAYAKNKGFKPMNNDNYKNGICALWDYDFYKSFSNYLSDLRKKQKERSEKRVESSPEPMQELSELKKLHPLVTDEKCFKLTWFPETIPVGWENIEELEID